ncbi:MAG: hypothetical protein WKG07_37620 [Hymenobacter sp.]
MPNGDAILPLLNALQPRFNLVVATQDWHPAAPAALPAPTPASRFSAR